MRWQGLRRDIYCLRRYMHIVLHPVRQLVSLHHNWLGYAIFWKVPPCTQLVRLNKARYTGMCIYPVYNWHVRLQQRELQNLDLLQACPINSLGILDVLQPDDEIQRMDIQTLLQVTQVGNSDLVGSIV